MFRIILTFGFTLMHTYVFWRAASVPLVNRYVSRMLLIGLGVLIWVGFFLALVFAHDRTGAWAAALEFLGMSWLGVVFLASVCVLGVDVITGFGLVFPRYAPLLRGWALFAGGVLSVIALAQGMRPPIVQHYEVRFSGLPAEMDGKVIVAMSDLHIGSLLGERWLEARVRQVQALRPDLVALLGDIFEGHEEPQGELFALLRRLSAPLGVWAVTGNHEFYGIAGKNLFLNETGGIQLLRNRWVEVRPGLVVAGVDDLTARRRAGQGSDPITPALAGRPPAATILLSHTPWQADKAAKAGVGLMLSGHTHGGQLWPFGYLVRFFYPLFAGRYEVDGMTVIVCRGTGTWGPRMRLWRPSEILCVKLSRP